MTGAEPAWERARAVAGAVAPLPPVRVRRERALSTVLVHVVRAQAALPAVDTAAMDRFAVFGPGPWRVATAWRARCVRDALGPAIAGLAAAYGGDVASLGYVGDERLLLADGLAADDVDIHVVTGGSSRGRTDWPHEVLTGMRAEFMVAAVLTLLAPLVTALSGAPAQPCRTVPWPPDVPRRPGSTVLVPVRRAQHGALCLLPRCSSGSLLSVTHASGLLAVGDGDGAVLLTLTTGLVS